MTHEHRVYVAGLLLLGLCLSLATCGGAHTPQASPTLALPSTPTSQPTATPKPTAPPTVTPNPTSTPVPTATAAPLMLSAPEGAPEQVIAALQQALPNTSVQRTDASTQADVRLDTSGDRLISERILVPVTRFSSLTEGITLAELREVWTGSGESAVFKTIYPSEEILSDLEALLGAAGPAVNPQPVTELDAAVWADASGIGIVPFEELTPRLRALRLDGMSAVDNRLDPRQWPLATRLWLSAETERGAGALQQTGDLAPISNRDPKKLTVLVMTGVTAMARGTGAAIEKSGDYAFPARLVGPELAAADITIISNEIPFVEGCLADDRPDNLTLCSKPEYFAALELSGVDAVGLTGNHQNDFGYQNDLASLEFYAEKGIPVYGGGKDDEAARAPLILEHHGNRLAFLGANPVGPETYWSGTGEQVTAWAGPDNPGSARFDRAQMIADIQAVKPKVDLVLAELQHWETNANGDYQTEPVFSQEEDFRALRDAGADVVTGVMAHAPEAVELRAEGGLILYGLGNLYFDQTWSWPTRTGLVARHTIYDGKLLNTELLVTVIEQNMQLRWATPEERRQVLQSVYSVSRW
jgi:hypothetical protein